MSFASPALLAALGLLLPVLLAFLVRRRRDVIRVPSTLLWRMAGIPSAQNRRFKSLRRLVSLLACLFAVAALAVAAARPTPEDRGETVAFVIDVSASMEAGHGKKHADSPLALAKRFAARRIASGGTGDRYAIIAAGAVPTRLAGPVPPGPALDEALDALHAERGGADVEGAIELAGAILQGAPLAKIVVLGDGGESTGGALEVRDVPVSRRTFPPPSRDNLGIAAFATRPAPGGGTDEREALITIATSSHDKRAARVTLSAEGREIARRRVEVPAGGEAEVKLSVVASAGRLAAKVEPDDGLADALASDDEAVIDGAARPPPRVILVAPEGDAQATAAFFAEKALTAAGVKEIVHAHPDLQGTERSPRDLFVVLGEGLARAPDAPALYLATTTGALPVGGLHELTGQATHLRSLDAHDPLLKGVALDGVTVEHATAAATPPGARALVDLDGGSVVLAGGAGPGAFVYLGIDPARSDLVLRVAFPVLVANAIHTLAGAADVVAAETVARSEIMLREAPPELLAAEEEPDATFRASANPAVLLAALGVLLLSLEAWAFRKGWSL